MSNVKLKVADGLDDLDEVIDVSPDLKKQSAAIPVKAKGNGGGSTVVIDKKLDDISSEEEEEYEESSDEEEDATRESKEKSNSN